MWEPKRMPLRTRDAEAVPGEGMAAVSQVHRAGSKVPPGSALGDFRGLPALEQRQRRQVLRDASRHLPQACAWRPREGFSSAARADAGPPGLGWRHPRACEAPKAQSTARARKLRLGLPSVAGPAPGWGAGCHPAPGPQRRGRASSLGQDQAAPAPRLPSRGGGGSRRVSLGPRRAEVETPRASAGESVRDSPVRPLLGSPTGNPKRRRIQEQPSYRFAPTKWR